MAITGSPDVFVSEQDLSTYVGNMDVTTAALAGDFTWGPAGEVIRVSDEARLKTIFGGPIDRNYKDWLTAAASYNAGQGGISKRLTDQKQKKAMDFFLPTETSRYMFRILTAKYFFEHPEDFGFNIEPEDRYPYLPPRETVTVSEPIPNLTDFAEEHGTTYFHLKEANLWLRSDKLTNKAAKTYKIVIPTTEY